MSLSDPEDNFPTAPRPLRLDGVCLLVIDDNEQYAELLKRAIEAVGGECHVAVTVVEAKRLLVVKEPDAAIVDLLLLNGSGLSLIDEFLAFRPSLSCVLHSSMPIPEGADLPVPFVPKPCDLDVLFAVVLDEIGKRPTDPPPTERGT